MKRSKFNKLIDEMIAAEKKFVDNVNELIQDKSLGMKGYTTSNLVHEMSRSADRLMLLEDLKTYGEKPEEHPESLFGISPMIKLEEDE
jgi:hypothetical protein